jgi:hypothetical protein
MTAIELRKTAYQFLSCNEIELFKITIKSYFYARRQEQQRIEHIVHQVADFITTDINQGKRIDDNYLDDMVDSFLADHEVHLFEAVRHHKVIESCKQAGWVADDDIYFDYSPTLRTMVNTPVGGM